MIDKISKYLVKKNITIEKAFNLLNENTKKSLIIVNSKKKILGLINDGDIRRAIDKSNYFFDMTAQDFMSKDFISVTPSDLASECLRIMAEKKIGCLAVMQDKILVGIINQKDLVKLGI